MAGAGRARAIRATVLAALLGLGLAGCGAPSRPPAQTYVVRAGDTLYSISWRHGLDYHEVARLNGIGADYRLAIGQVLRLTPGAPLRVPARTSAALPAPLPVTAAPHWVWPVDGRPAGTIRQPAGGIGLTIEGAEGAEVRAAAAGKVVYTGDGLRGYGRLVIIKHDEAWLTAYGYNRAVYVAEGETVQSGQRIAAIGDGPDHRPMLYFEIRLNGRPVDPATQLPARH
ncbi:MAG TPA: peptidoglycan DD-metalloendopeptidase family protein [Steroidobacteraceae bacterium]|nr:peptidoglycan DD-metalloendopeptidase family protein [Steroidobacteraceae bacterium]